jgi:hypothetical protein
MGAGLSPSTGETSRNAKDGLLVARRPMLKVSTDRQLREPTGFGIVTEIPVKIHAIGSYGPV